MGQAHEVAHLIIESFDQYIAEFNEITRKGRTRFLKRDWHGIQADSKKRINIYKRSASRTARKVKRLLKAAFAEHALWLEAKTCYAPFAQERAHGEIAETYFNSVCRKVLDQLGADAAIMFVKNEQKRAHPTAHPDLFRSYHWEDRSASDIIRQILLDYQFDSPYEDLERDISNISDRLQTDRLDVLPADRRTRIDLLKSVFFRNKAAYLVGRLHLSGEVFPFVIPFLHREAGVFADTLITDQNTTSIIFSFTRSYFMVEVSHPSQMVQFLTDILPLKPYGDLFNSIGFSKHGKTELYRDFINHLEQSTDQFVFAPGIKGMVMAVFTLPSYNIVFKLIKDKFDPPKVTNKAHVKARYKLVSRHDRVGRMADTHEFEFFSFPKNRFAPKLLEELLQVAPSIVHIQEDTVVIDHLYTERRMTPLNLYLEDANEEEAEEAVAEYGNTIKQLAAANIFPGDMLLKNFGVTRHQRVVFYDYDEIGFLTDYIFRRMPETEGNDMMMEGTPWFAVGPNDVFPQEFKHFLIGREDIREIFYALHDDLFDPKFWIEMQQKQINGEIVDVFPYRREVRFGRLMM
ncbi:MAG: bifunctional isocitrate dehydrogenase kinase/phosphatase [Bacteroidota bacterium]